MNPDSPENNTPDNNTPDTAPASTPQPRSVWARYAVIGAVALTAVGGIGLVSAMSDGFGRGGPGMHHAMGFAGKHGMGFGERRIDRVLEEIDATPEQSEKIKAIIEAAGDDLFPMAEEFRGTREDVAALLGAPTIDRAAAETLRAERIAKADAASKRLVTAVLDVADVLTAEQRAELVDHFKDRGRRGRW